MEQLPVPASSAAPVLPVLPGGAAPAFSAKPLPPRRLRFVDEYLVDLNGAGAARRAGYSAKGAGVKAFHLLRERAVAEAIGERIAARANITRPFLAGELVAIIRNPAEETPNRLRAIEILARVLGLLTTSEGSTTNNTAVQVNLVWRTE